MPIDLPRRFHTLRLVAADNSVREVSYYLKPMEPISSPPRLRWREPLARFAGVAESNYCLDEVIDTGAGIILVYREFDPSPQEEDICPEGSKESW